MLNLSPIPLGSIRDIAPVFIVGTGRSGTTPLQLALNMHPQLGVYGETQAFFIHRRFGAETGEIRLRRLLESWRGIVSDCCPYKDLLDRDEIQSGLAHSPNYAQVVNLIMGAIAARDGKSRWGEKSPAHLFRLPEIRSCFPGAQILHIVRDPRAVVCSSIKAFSGGRFTDWNIYSATKYWLRCFKIHTLQRAEHTRGRYMLVHYEDLVTHPETTLRKISSFLGIDFEAEMLNFHRTASKYVPKDHSGNMPSAHALTQAPLDASRADAWKGILSREQTRLIEQIAGSEMRTLGYEPLSSRQDSASRMRPFYFSGLWIASESYRMACKQAKPGYWAIQRAIKSREGTDSVGQNVPEVVSCPNSVPLNRQLSAKRKSVGLRPGEAHDEVRRSGT